MSKQSKSDSHDIPPCPHVIRNAARRGRVSPRRGGGVSPRRGGRVSPRRGGGVSPRRGSGVLPCLAAVSYAVLHGAVLS